jgi:hypothetical protein
MRAANHPDHTATVKSALKGTQGEMPSGNIPSVRMLLRQAKDELLRHVRELGIQALDSLHASLRILPLRSSTLNRGG